MRIYKHLFFVLFLCSFEKKKKVEIVQVVRNIITNSVWCFFHTHTPLMTMMSNNTKNIVSSSLSSYIQYLHIITSTCLTIIILFFFCFSCLHVVSQRCRKKHCFMQLMKNVAFYAIYHQFIIVLQYKKGLQ